MTVPRPLPPPRRPLPPSGRRLPSRPLPSAIGQPAARRSELVANARLAARDDVTATLASFTLVLEEPLVAYRAGQYVSVGLVFDGELIQRPYSVVSLDATQRRLELLIRRLPDGRFSNMLWRLAAGARLRVGPARGLFVLDDEDGRPRLFAGTGAGLAPLMAMLAELGGRRDPGQNVLVHGVAYQGEFAYAERIAALAAGGLRLDYVPSVSRPLEERNAGWAGASGRVDAQLTTLLAERPQLARGVAYLCGNPGMVETCRAALVAAGYAPADIRVEHFHPPATNR